MILLRLFWEFFKTGLFAVGGGMATLPFMYDISTRTGWFTHEMLADMVAVSALRNENTDLLMDVLYRHLPEGPMFYDEDTVTEQPMRDIAAEMIREQALRLLRDEIPHGIAVTVESMKERENGIIDLEASIICERDSHKGMIIGKGGQMLKRIGTGARIAIEEMCEAKVNLKLWVKVRRDWRDDETQLKSFGYDARKLR